jgi:deoxyadenosine/deoxycytidine kinase
MLSTPRISKSGQEVEAKIKETIEKKYWEVLAELYANLAMFHVKEQLKELAKDAKAANIDGLEKVLTLLKKILNSP